MSAPRNARDHPPVPRNREKVYFSRTDKAQEASEGSLQPPKQEFVLDATGQHFIPVEAMVPQPAEQLTFKRNLSSADNKCAKDAPKEGHNSDQPLKYGMGQGRLQCKKTTSVKLANIKSRDKSPSSAESSLQSTKTTQNRKSQDNSQNSAESPLRSTGTTQYNKSRDNSPNSSKSSLRNTGTTPQYNKSRDNSPESTGTTQHNKGQIQDSIHLSKDQHKSHKQENSDSSCEESRKRLLKSSTRYFIENYRLSLQLPHNVHQSAFSQNSKLHFKSLQDVQNPCISRKHEKKCVHNGYLSDCSGFTRLKSTKKRFTIKQCDPHHSKPCLMCVDEANISEESFTHCLKNSLIEPSQIDRASSTTILFKGSNVFPQNCRSYILSEGEIEFRLERRKHNPNRSQSQTETCNRHSCNEDSRLERTTSDGCLPSSKRTYFLDIHNRPQPYDSTLFQSEHEQKDSNTSLVQCREYHSHCSCCSNKPTEIPHQGQYREGSCGPVDRKNSVKIPDRAAEADSPHIPPKDLPNIFVMLQNMSKKPASSQVNKESSEKAKTEAYRKCESDMKSSLSETSVDSGKTVKGILKNRGSEELKAEHRLSSVLPEFPEEAMTDLARFSDPTTPLLKYRMKRHLFVPLQHAEFSETMALISSNRDSVAAGLTELTDIFGISSRETGEDSMIKNFVTSEEVHICTNHGVVKTETAVQRLHEGYSPCRYGRSTQSFDPFTITLPLSSLTLITSDKGKLSSSKIDGISTKQDYMSCSYKKIKKAFKFKAKKPKITIARYLPTKRFCSKRCQTCKQKVVVGEGRPSCHFACSKQPGSTIIVTCHVPVNMDTNTSAAAPDSESSATDKKDSNKKDSDKKDSDKKDSDEKDKKSEDEGDKSKPSGVPYSQMNRQSGTNTLYGKPADGNAAPPPAGLRGCLSKICPCLAPKPPPPPPATPEADQPPATEADKGPEEAKSEKGDKKEKATDDASEEDPEASEEEED